MSKPLTQNYRQIPVLAFSEWSSVPSVKQALNAHEWGMFRESALLVEAMGRDDRIEGVQATRLNALNGLPLEWEPADESQKALDVAADVKKLFHKMIPEALGNDHRAWGLNMGIGLAELQWDTYGGDMWVPTIRIWNPQYLNWRWDTWTYWLNTMDVGQLELFSGAKGKYKWFQYCPYGDERGWMHGMVRSLAIPWLIRQWDWRDWARYSEVHGSPIRAGIVPAQGDEVHKERFLRELSALGNEMVIRLEQAAGDGPKFDLKLIEAQANTWEGFEKLMTQANTAIAVRMLGQNLTTEIGGSSAGSRAAATVHDRVRSDFLRSDASTYAAAFKEQVLEPFCLFNYGSRNLAPTPSWKTDPPDDKKSQADMIYQLGQGLMYMQQAGVPVDVVQIAKRFDIPLIGEDESSKPQASKKQTNTAPSGETKKKGGSMGNGGGNSNIKLQSAARRLKPHVEAQLFVDEVADLAIEAAKRSLKPDLKDLLDLVQQSDSYQDLRRRLLKAYAEMSPSTLARLMDKCLVLADHVGRHSVLEEL